MQCADPVTGPSLTLSLGETLKRINDLLKDIERNGLLKGIGKPEQLQHTGAISRRIDQFNRLVYSVNDAGNAVILSCRGHYDD